MEPPKAFGLILIWLDNAITLPPRISEKYGLSDLFLFTGGGCHIFSRTLLELLPAENFQLRHLRAKAQFLDKPGYHVYLFQSGYAVDALGIRREEGMIALFTGQRGWTFTPEPCSVSFLFKQAREKEDVDPVNAWDMYLHPDFVDYVAAKARIIILDCLGRYQVSLLLAGVEKLNQH
jgi:hypothetical protein